MAGVAQVAVPWILALALLTAHVQAQDNTVPCVNGAVVDSMCVCWGASPPDTYSTSYTGTSNAASCGIAPLSHRRGCAVLSCVLCLTCLTCPG